MKLAVDVNVAKTLKQFEKLGPRAQKAVTDAVFVGANLIRGTAIENIKHGEKSGEKYPRLPNRSSAPGEAPATQSGYLADNIYVIQKDGGLTAEVRCKADYAFWLEFGTHTEGGEVWIAPRPFMMPAFRQWAPKVNALVRKAWKS